jgi:hypothetical protein
VLVLWPLQATAVSGKAGSFDSQQHKPLLDVESGSRGTSEATWTGFTGSALTASSVNKTRDSHSDTPSEALAAVLTHMRLAEPPVPFAHNYLLLQERVSGGQALVQVCDTAMLLTAAPTICGVEFSQACTGNCQQQSCLSTCPFSADKLEATCVSVSGQARSVRVFV